MARKLVETIFGRPLEKYTPLDTNYIKYTKLKTLQQMEDNKR